MKTLFLEQRVSLARQALDAKFIKFRDLLPKEIQTEFTQTVLDTIQILDGQDSIDACKRLGIWKPTVGDRLLATFDGVVEEPFDYGFTGNKKEDFE